MKKLLALLLALIMCVGAFAACANETKEPASPDTTDPGKTEDPSKPEDDTNKNIVIAHFDMTESYTLTIEKAGTVGDERIGVRCDAGKIQAGTYNTSGKKRTASYEFDFASLGLEGHSWEYLGATVEIDVSDENNPKIVNTPIKSTFIVKTTELKFPDNYTVELPNGIRIDLPTCNYGILRPNNLLNEGGWFIPGWNDKHTILDAQCEHFVKPEYMYEWAIFTVVDYKGTPINMYIHTDTDIAAHAAEIENGNESTSDTSSTPDTPSTPETPDEPSIPSVVPNASAKKVLVMGDFLLGQNQFGNLLANLLGADYDVKGWAYAGNPAANTNRLEFYEYFAFDKQTNECLGWQEGGKRAQDAKSYIEGNNPEYVVLTPGRRETMAVEDNARRVQALNAAKWLREQYPDIKIIVVSEQPIPDGVFDKPNYPDDPSKDETIQRELTISTAKDHNDLIKLYVADFTKDMANCAVANVGDAFMKAMEDGIKVYSEDPYQLILPNENGTYLTACIVYQVITGQSPVGLSEISIDATTAATLQNIAVATK
ncbi:MAG: hypothetical protein IKL40_00120 [Clostridia bacterium]|nr:hypothetical protein [Clostridia bacterium]